MKNPLNYIQVNLIAPKGQTNSFGKYKYRSCEDILTALKPHLAATDCHVVLSDEIISVEGRVYVRASASLVSADGQTIAQNQAFAREPLIKKGMDDSMITGTASSYARKYALNGLFLTDDQKDVDTGIQPVAFTGLTSEQQEKMHDKLQETNSNKERFLAWAGVMKLSEMHTKDFDSLMEKIDDMYERRQAAS